MTLDQALLTGLVAATVVGLAITWLVHRTQAKWRQRDLLKQFIGSWAEQVAVPTEVDAVRFEDESQGLEIEKDPRFPLAFKLVPKGLQHQYKKFIEARSTYITACHALYDKINNECEDRTGLPVGSWSNTRNWPQEVLLPNFILTIYEQALGAKQNTFRLEDISYNIGKFNQSGQGYQRKGLSLNTTYNAYSGLELAQADDEATLGRVQGIHRKMFEIDYCGKFADDVEHIGYLREEAETIAKNIREALYRLQVA